ncbi:phage holin family protein [Bergeyella porcorum]|uniref:phage holin family protein n=1 Tax=Bergeyella porcorum TaxID=1735111 RepID=UPI0035E8DC3E
MILDFIDSNWDKMHLTLIIISFCWIVVCIAILIDLYFGVKKARQMKEATSSEGFRRTINKATYYYALMTFALIFDAFDVVTPYLISNKVATIPFFSMFVALGLVLNEAKSVREKAEDKVRRKSDATFQEVIRLIKARQDLMDELINKLNDEKEK